MTADRTKTHEIPTSVGAVLITMGVVYGDIGTSPMYVMKSIVAGNGGLGGVSDELIDVYKRQVQGEGSAQMV